ncbi:hypothetical protein BN946_scf184845.g4 [Trametes cinnabarina]|uniref:Uncharacterized protein n=1 Tax=Pycnoporus cinnabarinus TaxID=5643 RepID=A0A060SFU9_PYCCI|nr:hypothetical protein BN946_scf184845.g4 [Trametes cinnabarina]
MLSSLGFDTSKSTGRNNRTGPSRFFPDMSRGLSTHVFKHTPATPLQPAPPAAAAKFDPPTARPPPSSGLWNRQLSYQASRNDSERKQPPHVALSQDRRLVQVSPPALQPWPVDTKYAKSQKGGSYLIHPSHESDVYIYERSILSVDDTLSSSPSSDSSEDSDLFEETQMANLEISSTRASSSTETLESTLYTNLTARGTIGVTANNAVPSRSRPPLAITAPPLRPMPPARPASTRPALDNSCAARPTVPLVRTDSQRPRTTSFTHPVYPVQLANLDAFSESDDSETVVSETQVENMVVDMLGPSYWSRMSGMQDATRSATPIRRDSVQRAPSNAARRDASDSARDVSSSRTSPTSQSREDFPRAPPGLYSAVATPPDGQGARGSAPAAPPTLSSSPPTANAPQVGSSASRSSGSPQQLARTASSRPPASAVEVPASGRASESPIMRPPSTSPTSASTRTRKISQQASCQCNPPHVEGATCAATAKRCVRWTEDLICPSPVPFENRRKGWFNRRGDQLWTNDGYFKSPEAGQEYPPDLAHYPEPNTGWMNEEGVRIDMQHRLIPKQPLRSALKQPKNTL